MEIGRGFYLTKEQKNSAGTIAKRAGLMLQTSFDAKESQEVEEPVYLCKVFRRPGAIQQPGI